MAGESRFAESDGKQRPKRTAVGMLLAAALTLAVAGALLGAGVVAPADAEGPFGIQQAYAANVGSSHALKRGSGKYAIRCWQKSKGSRTVCVSVPKMKKGSTAYTKRVKVVVKSLSGKKRSVSKVYSIAQIVKKGKIAIKAKALGSVKVTVSFYGKKGRPKKLAKTVTVKKIRLSCAHHSWVATSYRTVAVPTKYRTVHHAGKTVSVVCNLPILFKRFRDFGNDMDAFNSWLDEHGVPNRCFSKPISDYFGGQKATYVYTDPERGIHAGDEVGAEFESLNEISDYSREQGYIYSCNKDKYIPELNMYDNCADIDVEIGGWDEKVLVSKAHQEKRPVAWKCTHCGAEK